MVPYAWLWETLGSLFAEHFCMLLVLKGNGDGGFLFLNGLLC